MSYLLVTDVKYPGDEVIYQFALQQSDNQMFCKFPFTNQQGFYGRANFTNFFVAIQYMV